jgi:hypothetical protein
MAVATSGCTPTSRDEFITICEQRGFGKPHFVEPTGLESDNIILQYCGVFQHAEKIHRHNTKTLYDTPQNGTGSYWIIIGTFIGIFHYYVGIECYFGEIALPELTDEFKNALEDTVTLVSQLI